MALLSEPGGKPERDAELDALLVDLPLFAALSDKERERLARHARIRPLNKGETLFREGDEPRGAAVILAGTVKLLKLSPQGREHVLHLIHPGNLLGADVLFAGGPAPVAAVTVNKGRALWLDGAILCQLAEENGRFATTLLRALSLRLRMFSNKMVESQGKFSVSRRVAGWLLHRARMEGAQEIDLNVTRDVLARLLGITRESLSRELNALARQGIIILERRRIILLDKPGLKRLADN